MKEKVFCKTENTPIGYITVICSEKSILNISFENAKGMDDTALLRQTFLCLGEYFLGKRREFSIPFEMHGTDFQQKVWTELTKIPYGKTVCYEEIAEKIGNKKAVRAVGSACGKNPIGIIVPCHRVVGKNGSLTGYAGGISLKKRLLALEKAHI